MNDGISPWKTGLHRNRYGCDPGSGSPRPWIRAKKQHQPPSKAIKKPQFKVLSRLLKKSVLLPNSWTRCGPKIWAKHLMRAYKNRCIRIAGLELYLGKLMRSTALSARWGQQELMLISMADELNARYDFPFPEAMKYRNLKHPTALLENPRDD